MKKSLYTALIYAVLVGCFSGTAAAGSEIRLGYEAGGDSIGRLQFDNGDSKEFKFGTGVFVELGYSISTPVLDSPDLATEIYIGWKNDGTELSNGEVDYTRYLVGLNQYYKADRLRFGFGVSNHFKSDFEISGFSNENIELKHTLGFQLSGDYQVGDRFKIGVRYNSLNYKVDALTKVDGGSIGVFVSFTD